MLDCPTIVPATAPAMIAMARTAPPACVYLSRPFIGAPWQIGSAPARGCGEFHLHPAPSRSRNAWLLEPRDTRRGKRNLRHDVHLADRAALAEAASLIDQFGDYAPSEA